MFTGLIETIGTVRKLTPRDNYYVMTVESSIPPEQIVIGESINCNGACLTVIAVESGAFVVELSQETAARVDLSRYQPGRRINVERALQVGARLGGHFVSGHVDTTGSVDVFRQVGRSWQLAVGFDPKFDPLVIDKGSIAIDGVSLTVNEQRSGWLEVNIIPHTAVETTLQYLKDDDNVNLEFDLIGKYVARMKEAGATSGVTPEILLNSGW